MDKQSDHCFYTWESDEVSSCKGSHCTKIVLSLAYILTLVKCEHVKKEYVWDSSFLSYSHSRVPHPLLTPGCINICSFTQYMMALFFFGAKYSKLNLSVMYSHCSYFIITDWGLGGKKRIRPLDNLPFPFFLLSFKNLFLPGSFQLLKNKLALWLTDSITHVLELGF